MSNQYSVEQLASILNNADTRTNTGDDYYKYWEVGHDQPIRIRLLPDLNQNNPLVFLFEKKIHTLLVNGRRRNITCLGMYNEECPICRLSSAYYSENNREKGKMYWARNQYLAQALIIEDPLPVDVETGENSQGKVKILTLDYYMFDLIKRSVGSGRMANVPFAFENGYDFIMRKVDIEGNDRFVLTQDEEMAYGNIASKFVDTPSSLSPETIQYVQEHMVDLSTMLPQNPGIERVEAMLHASLTNTVYNDGYNNQNQVSETQTTQQQTTAPVQQQTTAPVQQQTTAPVQQQTTAPVQQQTTAPVQQQTTAPVQEYTQDVNDILALVQNRKRNNL